MNKENKLLWKIQEEFEYALENAKNEAIYGDLTIRELLHLGFNNKYLRTKTKKVCLGYEDADGSLSKKLTDEQLNVKIKMHEDYGYFGEDTDGDGYYIAEVWCINSNDEKLFEDLK